MALFAAWRIDMCIVLSLRRSVSREWSWSMSGMTWCIKGLSAEETISVASIKNYKKKSISIDFSFLSACDNGRREGIGMTLTLRVSSNCSSILHWEIDNKNIRKSRQPQSACTAGRSSKCRSMQDACIFQRCFTVRTRERSGHSLEAQVSWKVILRSGEFCT